jgi:tRNA modification GTPase
MDTIFALASARGKAGVAVVRVSGPGAWDAGRLLAGSLPAPRQSALRRLTAQDGSLLDEALVLPFQAGHSFTGEDVIELHLHGSLATVKAVLRELGQIPGLRLAEPGEFTRRALENECLDLAQVEGLSDLIEAETEGQRRQAVRVLSGALGRAADAWRGDLIRAAALLEATIDFADEDVPVDVTPEVTALIDGVLSTLRHEAEGAKAAERMREGFEVAIVGPPNVGKSTLLNTLAGREAALTSDIAGTTRDVIEVRMDLHGLPVTLLDTAGLRETSDLVEGLGVKRAMERAKAADLRLILKESPEDAPLIVPEPDDIVAVGKADLASTDDFAISGVTGAGVDRLIEMIVSRLEGRASGIATATRERHRLAILAAIGALESARDEVGRGPERSELAAEDLRTAIRALDSLVGRIDVEHILDEIFASFCLGK